jgi:hypothetical protein
MYPRIPAETNGAAQALIQPDQSRTFPPSILCFIDLSKTSVLSQVFLSGAGRCPNKLTVTQEVPELCPDPSLRLQNAIPALHHQKYQTWMRHLGHHIRMRFCRHGEKVTTNGAHDKCALAASWIQSTHYEFHLLGHPLQTFEHGWSLPEP